MSAAHCASGRAIAGGDGFPADEFAITSPDKVQKHQGETA